MNSLPKRWFVEPGSCLCYIAIASCQLALAQDTANQISLPTAKEIVEKSIQAAGGTDSYRKIKTISMRGSFCAGESKEIDGTIVMHYSAPDHARVTVDLGKLGITERGVNSRVAWERSTSKGERKLGITESRRLLESISLQAAFEPTRVYAVMNNRGMATISGTTCYHLEMVRPGAEGTDQIYFSTETGLPARTITSRPMTAGGGNIQSDVSDYKDFDGIKIATTIVQYEKDNVTYKIEIDSVNINRDIDETVFDEPRSMKSER